MGVDCARNLRRMRRVRENRRRIRAEVSRRSRFGRMRAGSSGKALTWHLQLHAHVAAKTRSRLTRPNRLR